MARDIAGSFAAGASIGERKRERAALIAKKRIDDARTNFETSRTRSLEGADQFFEAAVQLAAAGTDPEDPQFKAIMEQGARGILMGHANVLREYQATAREAGEEEIFDAIEDPNAFVENKMLLGQAKVDAAFAARPTTITGDDLPEGIPKDAVVQQAGDGKLTMLFKPGAEDDPSKLEMLQASNLGKPLGELTEDEMANAIAGGRLQIIYDPITRTAVVTDLAGKPVAEPVSAPTDEPGIVPDTADPTQAVGVAGAGRNVINVLGDAFGAGVAWPEAQAATVAMEGLSTRTMLQLTGEMKGRPTNLTREEIKNLTPKPNSIFTGESRAREKFSQIKALIDSEIERLDLALEAGVAPTDHGVMTAASTQLKDLSADYETMLKKWDTKDGGTDRAAGVAASQAALDAGDLEKARAINDALESGDAEALKKAMGDGGK